MAIIRKLFTTEISSSKAKEFRKFLGNYGLKYKAFEYYGNVKFEISCSHYERTEILDFIKYEL